MFIAVGGLERKEKWLGWATLNFRTHETDGDSRFICFLYAVRF